MRFSGVQWRNFAPLGDGNIKFVDLPDALRMKI
jgi:hypothetical protein